MWTDNETSLDLLGFRVHADLIRSVVTEPSLLPVTMGVFADWGGGKTSLMKMLEESFDPDSWPKGSDEQNKCENTACLYFNGWLFEGYDDAKSAILSSVLVALGEHKRFGPQVRDKCVSLLKSVNWMRVAHLGLKHVALPAIAAFATGGASVVPTFLASAAVMAGTGTGKPDVDDAASTESPDSSEEIDWEGLIKQDKSKAGPLDVRTFRKKFGQLLKECKIDSLVILIDDLDRCSPERIIENLEAIKLFLNVENTAFVIGADPRIVKHAIAWKYKKQDDVESESPSIVNDYLEKLIQYPYRLPKLSPAEIETYMALLFCQTHLTDDLFRKTVKVCDSEREKNRYKVFGYADVKASIGDFPFPKHLDKALAFSASAAPLITEGLKGNPRQVKRFLNAFVLRKKLAEAAKLTNIDDDVLVKLMILEYADEAKFRQLYDWQSSQKGSPNELVDLESSTASDDTPDGWEKQRIQRWLHMKPELAGVDLRDYFWVARDRLESTISGMSLVPPLVRRILEDLVSVISNKRIAAMKSAKSLVEEEAEMLFDLLHRNAKQNSNQKTSYDAYRVLIEGKVSGASEQYSKTLDAVPATEIPPAVGSDLLTLIKSHPSCRPFLENTIDSLKSDETKIGKMIKNLDKPKKE